MEFWGVRLTWLDCKGQKYITFDLRHHAKAAPNLPLRMAFMLILLQIDWAKKKRYKKTYKTKVLIVASR